MAGEEECVVVFRLLLLAGVGGEASLHLSVLLCSACCSLQGWVVRPPSTSVCVVFLPVAPCRGGWWGLPPPQCVVVFRLLLLAGVGGGASLHLSVLLCFCLLLLAVVGGGASLHLSVLLCSACCSLQGWVVVPPSTSVCCCVLPVAPCRGGWWCLPPPQCVVVFRLLLLAGVGGGASLHLSVLLCSACCSLQGWVVVPPSTSVCCCVSACLLLAGVGGGASLHLSVLLCSACCSLQGWVVVPPSTSYLGTAAMAMDTDDVELLPPLAKRGLHTPAREDRKGKTQRTAVYQQPHADLVKASFLLWAVDGARVFANPAGSPMQALHTSPLSKYLLEWKSRSLGNRSALVVAVWEHNLPKVPFLQGVHFTLVTGKSPPAELS
ncbi:hypothetical protein GWK47_034589 [Chionoecetes opilio]|uniref:Uncharacterized protein n=1 Tax=Chionoecetes opilio TaxID=41210 RepID=A0A8J5CZV7_CHIOP|nr:hypothetical protein GWK47_034589 [Chionoecetes opilio]